MTASSSLSAHPCHGNANLQKGDSDCYVLPISIPVFALTLFGLRSNAQCAEISHRSPMMYSRMSGRGNGRVHEDYNAASGAGDAVVSSEDFYPWGAVLKQSRRSRPAGLRRM